MMFQISSTSDEYNFIHPISTTTPFVDDDLKCFLCNHIFLENEPPRFLFDKLTGDEGTASEDSLAAILSHALGVDLEEGLTHSNLICYSCKTTVLEYDQLDKRAYELRQLIVANYNETVRLNDPQPESDAFAKVLCKLEEEESNSFAEILQADGVAVENSMDMTEIKPNIIVLPSTMHCNPVEAEKLLQDNYVIADPSAGSLHGIGNQPSVMTDEFPNEVDGAAILDIAHGDTDLIIIDDTMQSLEDIYSCGESGKDVDADSTSNQAPGFLVTEEIDDTSSVLIDDPTASYNDFIDESSSDLVEDIYMCFICNIPTEHSRKDFEYHMRTLHDNKFHLCEMCKRGYGSQQELRQHTLYEHSDVDKGMEFVCQTCKSSFSNQRQLRVHKRLHYNNTKHYECTECHKRYSSKYLLEEHWNMHTGERPFKCSQCPKDFASKYTLHAHMKIHTVRHRPYQCDKCDKSYLNQHHLTKHQQQHTGVKNHICEICSKAFTTMHNLTVHQIVHTGERPFICRTCGKSFARRAEIKDHERIHTGEKPFKCDICDIAFAQRSNLMSHKKSTHLNYKQHKCEECNRSFKRRRLLDYHIQSVHTGERPYKCKTCGAAFVYPEHYKKHILIHSGKKPYSCEVCGKLFNSCDNRNAHRFIHSDKKPYECSICGAGFMRKPLLLAHIDETGHYNEKIIVNRPVINKTSKELYFKPSLVKNENSAPSADGEDTYESHLDDGESTEFGEATYVQFEGLDEHNPDTLTWVALRDENN